PLPLAPADSHARRASFDEPRPGCSRVPLRTRARSTGLRETGEACPRQGRRPRAAHRTLARRTPRQRLFEIAQRVTEAALRRSYRRQNPISSLAARFQRKQISSFVITAPEPSNQCSFLPTLMSSKPSEKTGAWTPSN